MLCRLFSASGASHQHGSPASRGVAVHPRRAHLLHHLSGLHAVSGRQRRPPVSTGETPLMQTHQSCGMNSHAAPCARHRFSVFMQHLASGSTCSSVSARATNDIMRRLHVVLPPPLNLVRHTIFDAMRFPECHGSDTDARSTCSRRWGRTSRSGSTAPTAGCTSAERASTAGHQGHDGRVRHCPHGARWVGTDNACRCTACNPPAHSGGSVAGPLADSM